MNTPSLRTAAGVVAAVWAAFLLPPQLAVWSPSDTPEWMMRLSESGVYEWFTARGASLGLTDPYFLYGAAVAPSFLLIGWVFTHATRGLGWTGRALSWLTFAAAPVVVISYAAEDWPRPWATLIVATPLVIVVSTVIVRYYPHGTLMGMGLQAAGFGLIRNEPVPEVRI